MNKKVSENFRYIHDVYLLQCLCTEYEDMCFTLQQKVEQLENELKVTNNLLHKANDEVVSYCIRCIDLEKQIKQR